VLAAVQLEVEGKGAILGELGRIRLGMLEMMCLCKFCVSVHTKFRTPAGVSFWSPCLAKNRRPFPVTLDQAAVGLATSAFSPRRYCVRLDVGTAASSPNQKYFFE
jgi:hypothetical protein